MLGSGLIRIVRSAGFTAVAAGALAVLVLAVACRGGDEAPSSPGEPVDDEGAATVSNALADAIADYIGTTGLDGETFELADPADCAAIEDSGANVGKICLDFANSEIGEAAAQIEAKLVGSTPFWTLTLRVQNGAWMVTDVASGTREGSRARIAI